MLNQISHRAGSEGFLRPQLFFDLQRRGGEEGNHLVKGRREKLSLGGEAGRSGREDEGKERWEGGAVEKIGGRKSNERYGRRKG